MGVPQTGFNGRFAEGLQISNKTSLLPWKPDSEWDEVTVLISVIVYWRAWVCAIITHNWCVVCDYVVCDFIFK